MTRQSLLVLTTALLLYGGAAADAAWAGSPDIIISAKAPGGPYSDVAAFHLGKGQTKTVKLKVEVSTGVVETGVMQQAAANPPGCAGYKVRYFTKNGQNITSEVKSTDGRELTVQPDKPKIFELTIKRRADADRRTVVQVRTTDENDDTRDAFADVNNGLLNCV
jgi:hypothetical protein